MCIYIGLNDLMDFQTEKVCHFPI